MLHNQSIKNDFMKLVEVLFGWGENTGLSVLLAVTHSISQRAHLHFNEVPFSTSHNQWASWLCDSGLWAVTGQGRWFCVVSNPAASVSVSCFFYHRPLSLRLVPQLQKQVNICFSGWEIQKTAEFSQYCNPAVICDHIRAGLDDLWWNELSIKCLILDQV